MFPNTKFFKKIIKVAFTSFLIIGIFWFGAPFEAFLSYLRDSNVVDQMYLASKDSNVVDEYFSKMTNKTTYADGLSDAMVVYDTLSGTSTPKYRVWNGSAWGSELSASDVNGTDIRHMQLKYAPTRDEAVLVVLTNTGEVQAQIFNGSSWGTPTTLVTLNDVNGSPDGGSLYRGFDVEYEQTSGDAIVVAADGSADPNYYVWNGTSWASGVNIDIPTTGRPYWIELASRPGSDELAMISIDSNNDVYGMRWTGSAWDNMGTAVVWDASGSIGTKKAVDVAFETTSGDIMFAWGFATAATAHFRYRAYSGGVLGAVTNVTNANNGGVVHWLKLSSNPTSGSDQIMIGLLDAGADLNTFIWSGTAWSAVHAEHSAGTEDIVDMNFDIVFETHSSNPNDAWLWWGNSTTVSRRLWDGGTSAWQTATTQGDDTAVISLNAQPNSGAVFSLVYEDDTAATDDITENRLTGGSQTWGTAAVIWGGPVKRNMGASRSVLASQSYNSSTEAMMAYTDESSVTYPQYRRWTGSAWGSPASTSPVSGELRHMVLKTSPTRDEAILLTAGNSGRVEAQVWDGQNSVWGQATLLNTMNNAQGSRDVQSLYRGFDIEYENTSGDAIVVTGDGTADPNYHVWNGTGWTGPTNIDIPTTGRPNWIELASRPNSDELAMIVLDANTDVYGMRWTGSAWDNMGTAAVWDATASIATEKSIDVAYETASGDAMFIWGDSVSTDQYYRTYSGGVLSAATLLDNPNAGAVNNWMILAPNTGSSTSNQILYGSLDGGSDLNTFIWSGTAWSAVHTEHTAAAETNASQAFDIKFETHSSNPDDAWLVYGDGNTISRKLWNGPTSSWGTATTQGDDTDFMLLNAHPNSGAMFLVAYESSAAASMDITENRLTGGSQTWGTASALWGGPVARTGLPLTKIAVASERYILPTFEQSAYRFFANSNSTDVGSALALQDTPATLTSSGDPFRLRTLIHVGSNQVAQNGQSFKLQFVDKGAGSCASPSGGSPASYTDVTGATVIAFNDNATPSDGSALTSNANDPTHSGDTIVNQTYEESNNFTNSQSAIPSGQDGKWDFSLIDNGADPDTTFCFRVVKSNGSALNSYSSYPEITTASTGGAQSITFSISDNSIGFGTLNPSAARYATGDSNGSGSDSASAHTISASTNASGGYVITVSGTTLTCTACGGATIDAIGGVSTPSSVGTKQFGLRATVSSGNGTVASPYNSSDWALDTSAFPDLIFSGDGDEVETVFGVRYIGNIDSATSAGNYNATITYTITATF